MLIGAGMVLLTVVVAVLPRVRPDVVHLTLEYHGRPLKSFNVKLVENSPVIDPCRAEGLPGVTDAAASHQWNRELIQQVDQVFRPFADSIAVCAQVSGGQRLLWQRHFLGWKERTDLDCDVANATPACVAEASVTLAQSLDLAVVALLVALLARALWNWRRESAARVAVLLMLAGVFVSCLAYALPFPLDWRRNVSAMLVGCLVGAHALLNHFLRKLEEAPGNQGTHEISGLRAPGSAPAGRDRD
jgi:hypothetical protein